MKSNNDDKEFLKAYIEFNEHASQSKNNYLKTLIKESDKTLLKECEKPLGYKA